MGKVLIIGAGGVGTVRTKWLKILMCLQKS